MEFEVEGKRLSTVAPVRTKLSVQAEEILRSPQCGCAREKRSPVAIYLELSRGRVIPGREL